MAMITKASWGSLSSNFSGLIWGNNNYSSASTVTFGWPMAPAPQGPVDPTKLDELRNEIITKLTVGAEKPGFRDRDSLEPDTLNARVLELVIAVLLREGLLNTRTAAGKRGGEEGRT